MSQPEPHEPGAAAARGRTLAAAFVVALVAVAVRVLGLGRESLWLDEGFTWRLAQLAPLDVIAASRHDVHPPLHGLLVGALVRLLGDGETTLRAPSVVASCASVLFAARLARRAFGPAAAWGAAVLVALSVFQVRYAQEARSYALLGALALASADALLSVLERGRRRAQAALVLSATALLYTHAYAVYVVAAQAIAVALSLRTPDGRRAARALAWPLALVALAGLPWLGAFAQQVGRVRSGFWIAPPGAADLARTAFEFAGSTPLVALLGALAVTGLLRPSQPAAAARVPARALVAALALVPLLVPFASSFVGPPVYLTRAAIPAALGLAILAAGGWAALPRMLRAVVAVLIVAGSVPPLIAHHTRVYKEPWRDAVAWLERQARPGDLVLVTAPWYRDGVFAYYAKRRDLDVRRTPLHDGPFALADLAALAPDLGARPRVWLVRARADDPDGLLLAAVRAGRDSVAYREWKVAPAGLTRLREVRALDVFCYAGPPSEPTGVSSRP